jgi:hypothetical protein
VVTIECRVPICLEKYEFIEHMGRFTLRDEGKTIALGKVLRYKPATISKADQERINNLADKYEESKEESDINGDQ